MNPRVSRSSALGEQGDRVPDRQDRGQARGRLPPRRDHERHHRRDAGVVRADHRLRRDEGPALGVREAARGLAGARHADAVGRRGDGDRPHVPRVAAEGAALARDRAASASNADPGEARARRARRRRARAAAAPSRRRTGCSWSRPRCARGVAVERLARGHRHRPVVPRPDASRSSRSGRPARRRSASTAMTRARLAAGQAPRLRRRASSRTSGASTETRCAPPGSPPASRVTYKTVDTCAAEFAADTPYHYGTYEDEDEVAPLDAAGGRDPRQRPEPHRAGRRVRLLLRARRVRAVGRRATRPSWSTATPRRSRPTTTPATGCSSSRSPSRASATSATRSRREGELAGVIVALGGQTPLKLAHALEAGGHPGARHEPGVDRPRRGPRAVQRAVRAARASRSRPAAPRPTPTDAARDRRTRSGTRCSCGRRTCSAGGRCRSSTTTTARPRDGRARGDRHASGARAGCRAERPALIDRFLEDAIEVDVDALRDRDRRGRSSAGSWSTSRRPACTRATPRARSRRRRSAPTTIATIEEHTRRARRRARRPRAAQRAVRGEGRRGVRDRGEPPREPHGPVRQQGHRRAAGQGRGPGDARRHAGRAAGRRAAATRRPRAATSR